MKIRNEAEKKQDRNNRPQSTTEDKANQMKKKSRNRSKAEKGRRDNRKKQIKKSIDLGNKKYLF